MARKGPTAKRKPWEPLIKGVPTREMLEKLAGAGQPVPSEMWLNGDYRVFVRVLPTGWTHLSIARHNKRAVRDWRHLQAIKNEVCGPQATGFEVFPPESQLVDTANEYHLWVLPPELGTMSFMGVEGTVMSSAESNKGRVSGDHKARQRPFQPGLPVGTDV